MHNNTENVILGVKVKEKEQASKAYTDRSVTSTVIQEQGWLGAR